MAVKQKHNKRLKPPMDPQMPEPGQTWKHRDGGKCEIVGVANSTPSLGHELSVVYRSEGNLLCCPILLFHRLYKFEAAKEITFEVYKALGADREIIPEFELRIMEERVVWRDNK